MVRTLLVVGLSILATWSLGPLPASASPYAPTERSRALAAAVVDASGDRKNLAKNLEPFERMLSKLIASRIAPGNPAASARVAVIVHEKLSPMAAEIADRMADSYSTTFSTQELIDILAFENGPGGQAEKINLPLLKADISAAITSPSGSTQTEQLAEQAFERAPESRRELELRIFKAQNLEAHTREGWVALAKIYDAAATSLSPTERDQKPKSDQEEALATERTARAADDYARLIMAVEKGFYATHYSDAELEAAVAYLESDAGQAMLARSPAIRRAVGMALQNELTTILPSLSVAVCSAVNCTADQRARLTEFVQSTAEMLPALEGILS